MIHTFQPNSFSYWRLQHLEYAMHRSVNKFWKKLRTIKEAWVESYLVSVEGDTVIYKVEFGIGSNNKSSVLYKIDIKDLDNDLEPERIMSEDE